MERLEHTLWVEKYRPTSLETYIGNEHLKSKVSVYLESGDLPHLLLYGKAGTGKTTLIKEGISKILNRNFEFIALGGATDSSFLEGHSYTYEGSQSGKIVDILIKSRCMNPVIYFDELDKISETPKGEEIAGILTHLTDTSQNSQFHDKYFSEIDFDLSKCLFIFSYNDESRINPILKDRMYRIQTDGYDSKQKIVIANNYLLPRLGSRSNLIKKILLCLTMWFHISLLLSQMVKRV